MSPERLEPVSQRWIPSGTMNQRRRAEARPQPRPAPGLVARFAHSAPNASPKSAPSKMFWVSDVSRSLPCSAPPSAPVKSASSGPTHASLDVADFSLIIECCNIERSRSEEHTSELQSHLNLV